MVFCSGRRLPRGARIAMWLALAFAVALGGCRPRDPLDWRMKARCLNEYNAWMHDVSPELGASLQREFAACTHNLALSTIGFRWPQTTGDLLNENNPFCRRIDGKTVREILIEYYISENDRLSSQILRDLDVLTKLYNVSDERGEKVVERRIPLLKQQIETNQESVRRNSERLRQLRGDAAE